MIDNSSHTYFLILDSFLKNFRQYSDQIESYYVMRRIFQLCIIEGAAFKLYLLLVIESSFACMNMRDWFASSVTSLLMVEYLSAKMNVYLKCYLTLYYTTARVWTFSICIFMDF